MTLRSGIVLALLLAAPYAAGAANIPVGPGDTAGLAAAITAANASVEDDVIVLAAGSTYDLTFPNNGVNGLPIVSSKITIQGNSATIRRMAAAEFRLFDVDSTGDLTLDRVTVMGGKLTFTAVPPPFFRDGGAGIRVTGRGKLTLTNTIVTQNTCTGAVCFGGGIQVRDAESPEVRLVDSVVSENSADTGGGICLNHNDQILHLTRAVIRNNRANEGGGIGTNGHDTITITDSLIDGNSVALSPTSIGALGGGMLDIGGATWTISGTTITGNSATGTNQFPSTNIYGGGFGENGGATIMLVNSTITGNSLNNNAGGLVAGAGLFSEGGGKWTLNNVTIAGNAVNGAGGSGGGMEATRGVFTVRNSIVHGNTAAKNPDCSALGAHPVNMVFDSLVLTAGHNIVGSLQGCTGFVAATGDQIGADPLLGPLAANGGPTFTRAVMAGSPALDAGDPGAPGSGTGCEPVDQRGVARPQGPRCDIGAVEGPGGVTVTTTTTLPLAGCGPPAPTFENIDCRLDELVAATQAADTKKLRKRLNAAITGARKFKIKAETLAGAGKKKPAKGQLKKAIRKMVTFGQLLRSLTGKRTIDDPVRASLLDPSRPILADMKTLLRSL
jgi:hypothetical protein